MLDNATINNNSIFLTFLIPVIFHGTSKFNTWLEFCTEMLICIFKVVRKQKIACELLSSVIRKKEWIIAASSYSWMQGL